MSISDFFNRKARAIVAAVTIGLGGAGGYAGHEIAQHEFQPQPSNFVLSQVNENTMTEKAFLSGQLPGGPVRTAQEVKALEDFTTRIDAMAGQRAANDAVALQDSAVSFISDLRISKDISEMDYKALLTDYNNRVGLDVSAITGNYAKGIMYNQEANVVVEITQIFSRDADDEDTSREVGAAMLEGQRLYDNAGLEGAAGGAALGMMLMIPVWMRRRRGPGFG